MTQTRVHLVCQAHLDPVWQWTWEEGAAEAISTFRTAADLCEAFDGFVFNHNEVILYEWVEEYEPALFRRIQRLVAEGRWHIMGGWYLQPDCNMPSGESLIRQVLAGRRYFGERFGVAPTTAVNLDPFGHSRGLVQILARAGYDSYLFCRPGNHDCPLPADAFRWVGFDGSEVLARRVGGGYNSPLGGARAKVERAIEHIPEGADCVLVLWGVGNHGGGPSRKDLSDLRDLMAERTDVAIVHSTPERYIGELACRRADLPRHADDLNPWGVGCYTSCIRLKQSHRRLENELFVTEKMVSAAACQELMEYPSQALSQACRDLLFAEFHDILPGSSVQIVEEAALRLMDHGLEELSRVKARAFFALATGQPKARDGQIPILVYNPHPYPVADVVSCEFQLADQNWTGTFTRPRVFSGKQELPSQVEKELGNVNLDWRKRVAFAAELLPGMNRFDCRLETLEERPLPEAPLEGSLLVVRGERLEVAVNTTSGLLDRCRIDGVDMLAASACGCLVMQDDADSWGMRTHSFREEIGAFSLLSPTRSAAFSGSSQQTLPAVRVVESGPVRTVIEAVFGFGDSFLCQRYLVPAAGTEIGLELRLFWNEKDRMAKLAIPLPLGIGHALGQTAFGAQRLRLDGTEAVAQKWLAVVSDNGESALTVVLTDGYGLDICERELRLTLLRSSAYAGHPIEGRPIVPDDRFIPRFDQGERLFRFWLNAARPSDRLAAIEREALAKHEAPVALSFSPHGEGDPASAPVLFESSSVVMSAFKRAEDGNGYIARLFEPTGQSRRVTLRFPLADRSVSVEMGAWEVRTFRCDPLTGDLVEVALDEGDLPEQ